ncbi:leucine-rich repeat domain-containing protein [Skeletonema marinoi]|uniref:Leucine-rich repeat domain-containing protein n=1 Tax=Skeletonema marinoi TaxID=267567 RepID=A0AAD8XU38_9STRA|nr:leucine-rich repeat domain-containing protein [Skeletonema marinoi]
MADALDDDDEVFVYMGGDQEVPQHVRRARLHRSVKNIRAAAFYNRRNLISVEFHDEIEIIEEYAFRGCKSLRGCIKLLGVKIIKQTAFRGCIALTGVEFGDVLETIEEYAFFNCKALTNIKMPSVRTIGWGAFTWCKELSDVECGEDLETIQRGAFIHCRKLKRIALPLRDNMIDGDVVFGNCPKLATVELVGGIHSTVGSLHMESWRNDRSNTAVDGISYPTTQSLQD